MVSPIYFNTTYKIYDTKEDYENDTDATVVGTYQDFIELTLLNRGDHISVSSDHYPRTIEMIDYYDVNPEYD